MTERRCFRRLVFALLLAVVSGPAVRVQAQVAVFHSAADDGVPPLDIPSIPITSAYTLNLYVEGTGATSSTGTICEDADGSELCAIDILIQGIDAFVFSGFTPEAGVVYDLGTTSPRLRLNRVDAISGITAPVRLGSLTVDTSQAQAGVDEIIYVGKAIDAGLDEISVPPVIIATVPEPGVAMGVVVCMPILEYMRRRRRKMR